MSKVTDRTDLGFFPLQDAAAADDGTPVGMRMCLAGARLKRVPDPLGRDGATGDSDAAIIEIARDHDLGTIGDVHPWLFWQTRDRGVRDMGAWSMVFGTVWSETEGRYTHGSAQPLRDGDFKTDTRFRAKTLSWPQGLNTIPKGALLVALPGTDEGTQAELALWADPRLCAPNISGPAACGTLVVDLQPEGTFCMSGSTIPGVGGRAAVLQSLVRVVAVTQHTSLANLGGSGNVLALQYGRSKQDQLPGLGAIFGPMVGAAGPTTGGGGGTAVPLPTGPTGPVTPRIGAGLPGRARRGELNVGTGAFGTGLTAEAGGSQELAIKDYGQFSPVADGAGGVAFMAALDGWGPIHLGARGDKHEHGHDGDGNPVNSAHVSTNAYFFRNSREDGPLQFEGVYPDPPSWPLTARVHLSWDGRARHPFRGGSRDGLWRWWAEVPYVAPTTPPTIPPTTPPTSPPSTPPPTTPGPGRPGPGPSPPGPGAPPGPGTPGGPATPGPPGPGARGGRGPIRPTWQGGGAPPLGWPGPPITGRPGAPGTGGPGVPPPPGPGGAGGGGPAGPRGGPSTPRGPWPGPGDPPPPGVALPPDPPDDPDPPEDPPDDPDDDPFGAGGGRLPRYPNGYPLPGEGKPPKKKWGKNAAPATGVWSGRNAVGGRERVPGLVERVGGADRDAVGLYTIFHPLSEGYAAVAFRPQLSVLGAPNFEHNPQVPRAMVIADERTRPQVVVLRAFGGQSSATGDWRYVERPVGSRARGGTANGGVVFSPARFELADYYGLNTGANVSDVTSSRATQSYVLLAPGVALAFGKPAATGALQSNAAVIDQDVAAAAAPLRVTHAGAEVLRAAVVGSERLVQLGGTTGAALPSGSTAQRPGSPVAGHVRINSSGATDVLEWWDNTGGAGWLQAWPSTVFVASGTNHAIGLVPDPGASAGTTKFLREDATWAVPSGSASGTLLRAPQILASGTSYTTPAGCTHILVEMIGAGGGGGGAAQAATNAAAGGGGAAGAFASAYIAVTASTAYTIAIGAGGGGGAAGNNDGSTGGNTTITVSGTTYTAAGGGGGKGCAAGVGTIVQGGDGSSSSNCDLNGRGAPGHEGIVISKTIASGGAGGSPPWGGGGRATGNTEAQGNDGKLYGGGGAGGCCLGTTARAGGAGANGVIRIWEFS
ncbi:MAG TPA: hypothetical protein VNM34_15045 [Verrucomicrobiae bacterium]|nr:hypothetical protein [Verrucomicrobiae bacterium]